jgi:hypothetical protein
MVDPSTPAATKARCAHGVLDHGRKAIELDDIQARLDALERSVGPNW